LNALPPIDTALSVLIIPCRDDCAVDAESEGVGRSRRDGDDVTPVANVALPMSVAAYCKDSAAREQADGVVAPRSHQDNVCPPVNIARA